jgi:hypothetical protein
MRIKRYSLLRLLGTAFMYSADVQRNSWMEITAQLHKQHQYALRRHFCYHRMLHLGIWKVRLDMSALAFSIS